MRDHGSWSLNLGRWGPLHIRLHLFFLLFAAFTLYLSWLAGSSHPGGSLLSTGFASIAILFGSVLLHECGHYVLARRLGSPTNEIVLGPLGGLSPYYFPAAPRSELLVYAAGPLVNAAASLLALGVLLTGGATIALPGLLHPLWPEGLVSGHSWEVGAKLTLWINWVLFLINLMPAFPFDMGRMLRAALTQMWPDRAPQRAAFSVALVAKLFAGGLLVLALFLATRPSTQPVLLVPSWFALVILALFLFFSAKQEVVRAQLEHLEVEGWDGRQGDVDIRSRDPVLAGSLSNWMERRRADRERRREQVEAEEEKRLDEILIRLHQQGMQSLSPEDRSLLDRASRRYRGRQHE